ncbi:MAG: CbiX/SirB N-terminal domain-containing protein [Betaproteobacteria bacterium]
MSQGLILFAHGARDPRWAEPFERLRERVGRSVANTNVLLAYLEIMVPDLPTAAAALFAAGCREIVVVPIFLGQGGHVRQDLPVLLKRAAAAYPDCKFRMSGAAGEDDAILDALGVYCLRQLNNSTGCL